MDGGRGAGMSARQFEEALQQHGADVEEWSRWLALTSPSMTIETAREIAITMAGRGVKRPTWSTFKAAEIMRSGAFDSFGDALDLVERCAGRVDVDAVVGVMSRWRFNDFVARMKTFTEKCEDAMSEAKRATQSRIRPGMPVISDGSVVGRVTEVSQTRDGTAYTWEADSTPASVVASIVRAMDSVTPPRPPRGKARRSRQVRSDRPRALRRALARGADNDQATAEHTKRETR